MSMQTVSWESNPKGTQNPVISKQVPRQRFPLFGESQGPSGTEARAVTLRKRLHKDVHGQTWGVRHMTEATGTSKEISG